jgi:hypothetical protein
MKYESPEIKVIVFAAGDIITTSVVDPNELEGDKLI